MKINNQAMISFSINRYQKNERLMEKSTNKLASGQAINQASDDASGLTISETMRAQLRGLARAHNNIQDGLSVLQAANDGLNNVNDLLQRGRELAVMNANDTLTTADREASQEELEEILRAINDAATKLEFNTIAILNEDTPLHLMVGANPGQQLTIDLVDTSTTALGLNSVSLVTRESAEQLIVKMDNAIKQTSSHLTKIGSYQEILEHHMYNSLVYESNMTASLAKIADTDIAKEMINNVRIAVRQNSDKMLVSTVNQSLIDVLKLVSR